MVSFHGVSLVDGVSFLHGEFDQLINEETINRFGSESLVAVVAASFRRW